jgi:uncharacterized protein
MLDLRMRLWQAAEDEAVRVFAGNLRDLLLAAPAGTRPTLGLDPGYRTGVKVAVVDATGKVVATDTIYPHEPKRLWDEAIATLARLCRSHKVELIAIGNGTASRETDRLAGERLSRHPDLKLTKVTVSEAGASVYSASAYASQELPELDVSLRGAVSIARRLQNPPPRRLLTRVSGLGEWVAQNIVAHRNQHGPFRTRKDLKQVTGLGPKTFELSAGFLRIPNGDDPLDASGVHPKAYPVVRRILKAARSDIKVLIGNGTALKALRPEAFTDETFGLPTVTDILKELEKTGRDPRPAFKTAAFREGTGEDRPGSAPGVQNGSIPRGHRELGGPEARDGAGGGGDERRGVRGLCECRRTSGRVGAHLGPGEHVRQRPAQRGQAGRRGACEGAGGGPSTQAHRAHDAAGRRGRAAPRA